MPHFCLFQNDFGLDIGLSGLIILLFDCNYTAKNGRLKQLSLVNSTKLYKFISTMLNVKTKKGSCSNQWCLKKP